MKCAANQLNDVIEIRLSAPRSDTGHGAILEVALAGIGIPACEQVEFITQDEQGVSFYVPDLGEASFFQRKISQLKLKRVRVTCRTLKKEDWLEKWKIDFKPFALTKNFDVVPFEHMKGYHENRRKPLILISTMAFGTGLHETTAFLARMMESRKRKFRSFLDIGTGTGILAIIAVKLGIKRVDALDIDRQAIREARKNLRVNKACCQFLSAIDIRKFKSEIQYEFVAANLTSYDLIKNRIKIFSLVKPRFFLAISGISLEHFFDVHESFSQLPLKSIQIVRGKQWGAILYQRSKGEKNEFKHRERVEQGINDQNAVFEDL